VSNVEEYRTLPALSGWIFNALWFNIWDVYPNSDSEFVSLEKHAFGVSDFRILIDYDRNGSPDCESVLKKVRLKRIENGHSLLHHENLELGVSSWKKHPLTWRGFADGVIEVVSEGHRDTRA
jgi:hypothetical protein